MRAVRAFALWLATTTPALACAPDPAALLMIPEHPETPSAYLLPGQLTLSQPLEMQLWLCGQTVERVSFDALMPAHRHGLNYDPSVQASGDGHFEISGIVFHMPGHWQIRLGVDGAGRARHYTLDLNAP